MSDAKAKIRKGVLFNRRLLSEQLFGERNALVINQALELLTHRTRAVHCFLPIRRNKEIDTWPLIKGLAQLDKSVAVSATDFKTHTMSHFQYSKDLLFENDAFGIPTPVNGEIIALQSIDSVIIPMLAADKMGNRIGYGKGYYDQLLTEMSPDVLKIGMTLGALFDHFSFAEAHDIALDMIITPFGIVDCKSNRCHQD